MIFSTEHARIEETTETLWRVEYRMWDYSKGSKPQKVTFSKWFSHEEVAKLEAEDLAKRNGVFFVGITKWKRATE